MDRWYILIVSGAICPGREGHYTSVGAGSAMTLPTLQATRSIGREFQQRMRIFGKCNSYIEEFTRHDFYELKRFMRLPEQPSRAFLFPRLNGGRIRWLGIHPEVVLHVY